MKRKKRFSVKKNKKRKKKHSKGEEREAGDLEGKDSVVFRGEEAIGVVEGDGAR